MSDLPEWLGLFGELGRSECKKVQEKIMNSVDSRTPKEKEAMRIASELVAKIRAASDEQQFCTPNLVRMVQDDIYRFVVKYIRVDDPIESAVDGLCADNQSPDMRAFARKCILTGMGEVRYVVDRLCDDAS